MNIQAVMKETELILALSGRIDSSNAAEFEKAITEEIRSNAPRRIVVDLKSLEYVSSAGLRVFLKTKKQIDDLELINCSPDVYEIFEVTGFDQILNIKKALRKVSLKGCEFVSRGGCGIVFRLQKDEIIKVFIDRTSEKDIRVTLDRAKAAFLAGIPTPISYDVVQVTDYTEPIARSVELSGKSIHSLELPAEGTGTVLGVIYEMMNSDTLAAAVMKHPEEFETYMQKFSELLKILHGSTADDASVEPVKDIYQERLTQLAPYVTDEELTNLRKFVSAIPDGDHYVHNDPHLKNIMVSDGELMFVDLDDISKGHPIFDFLALYNDLISAVSMEERQPGYYLQTMGVTTEIGGKVWKRLLELYFDTQDPGEIEKINQSIQPYVALRTTSVMGRKSMPEEIRKSALELMRKSFFPALPMLTGKLYWPHG